MYLQEGNKAFRENEFRDAIYFFTEGLKVNCKDDVKTAKLYSNRATTHYKMGKILVHVRMAFLICQKRKQLVSRPSLRP